MLKTKKVRNKAFLCFICGKEFAVKTMANHLKACHTDRYGKQLNSAVNTSKKEYVKVPADWEGRNYEDIKRVIQEIERSQRSRTQVASRRSSKSVH